MKKPAFRSDRREAVWRKANGFCFYCGLPLIVDSGGFPHPRSPDPDALHLPDPLQWMQIDHVQARRHGGSDREHNLQPACQSCNCSKGAKGLHEYRQWLAKKRGQKLVIFFGEMCA